MDRKSAEYWTGPRQNIGQEAGRILDRKSTVLDRKPAEFWTKCPQNIGQKSAEFDRKTTKCRTGSRQNFGQGSVEYCTEIDRILAKSGQRRLAALYNDNGITRELDEDCSSTLFGEQNTKTLCKFDFISRNGGKSVLSMKLEFCENFRCLPL